MAEIITCRNCGQKNRVSRSQDRSHAICAKCWARLNPPERVIPSPSPKSHTASRESPVSGGKFWRNIFTVFVIGGFVWLIASQDTDEALKRPTLSKLHQVSEPAGCPKVALPVNGEIRMYMNKRRIAPLEIRTARGANYLVKLVSVSGTSERTVMTIFAKGGETISTVVPLGTYEIRYAAGEKWCGYRDHFKHETNCCHKADRRLTFTDTARYTITLYSVFDGNLGMSSMSPERF